MKLFSAAQLKNWDSYSIREQHITSELLMEKAAFACFQWLIKNEFTQQPVLVFCSKGNNGGDGLALARMLLENNIPVTTYILETGMPGSNDFQTNLQRLHQITADIHYVQSENFFPGIEKNNLIIDALFGSGLNKPLAGIAAQLVEHINKSEATVIAIDIPSGLYIDKSTKGYTVIRASYTLSFQNAKLAFLMAENDLFVGEYHILNIGLSKKFEAEENTAYEIIDAELIRSIVRPRNKFSHKGVFGHAAIMAGSYGMMGAAVLAARACMYSGTGKLTCHIPTCGYEIMQTCLPEAMCKISGEKYITEMEQSANYDAIGIGPGLGCEHITAAVLKDILSSFNNTVVLDADALNIIAAEDMTSSIPIGTVITPHPKEFERMFGKVTNDFERLQLAIEKAASLDIYIILKGHYTGIVTPRGKVYFNSTGNAGMAKAGMGDVLTGIITGLSAQKYALPEALLLGVYLHGLAGDIAAGKYSQQAMQATDVINCIGDAWKLIAR